MSTSARLLFLPVVTMASGWVLWSYWHHLWWQQVAGGLPRCEPVVRVSACPRTPDGAYDLAAYRKARQR